MEVPENYSKLITGRASLNDWLKSHYPEFFEYLIKNYTDFDTLQSKLYAYYNNINSWPLCHNCGKRVKFHGYKYGFGKFCCPSCAGRDEEVKQCLHETMIKKYGIDYKKIIAEKYKNTCLEKYGVENAAQLEWVKEKYKKTCLEKYGVENSMQCKEIKDKSKQTCLEKYGSETYLSSELAKSGQAETNKKIKKTCLEKYGVENSMQCKEIKDKVTKICFEKYGVSWNCMRDEAHNSKNSKSGPNCAVSEILTNRNIEFTTEFPIGRNLYDFKIGNILLEVNPIGTHNINWSPFNKEHGLTKDYHINKSKKAEDAGYKCIHLWDWDNLEIVIDIINNNKKKIYARNCEVKEIKKKKVIDEFLNENHLQGTCRGQNIKLGLYYNDELVEVMTFGKPRYNNKYEYELLRLCTRLGYSVIGGASKLFTYFKEKYCPNSIISYCDKSKFDGNIYNNLGFNLIDTTQPACHWCERHCKMHITDNLLRKLGADAILGTNFGKGTSNEQIMLNNGFVQVYDCGQYVFEYKNNNI